MTPQEPKGGNSDPTAKFKHLLKTPKSLKLEFTKAADYDRVNLMFDPALLKQVDPGGYIARRLEPDFRRAVDGGSTVVLSDENDNVRTVVVNYQFFDDGKPAAGKQHDYTELGSVMSCMQGYKSGYLLAAAMGVKEWWAHPPKKGVVTEIKHDNTAPTKIYKALGWVPMTDKDEVDHLFHLCYSNVADEKGNAISGPPYAEKHNIGFYQQIDSTVVQQAKVILEYMDAGGVSNKTGDLIAVDFSGLDDAGLTRARLEALANGETSRDKLKKISAPKP